jgi:predicted transcriptional regulator YheO
MENLIDNMDFFSGLLDMLETHLGDRFEIVLHDWSRSYEHTIVDIRNNHITNRNINDCGSNLGLEVMRGDSNGADRYNYITKTRDGKTLRSSSHYIRNSEGKIIGALCINTDISETIQFEQFLKKYNKYDLLSKKSEEFFANDVTELLDYYIEEAQTTIGKSISNMDKSDKIRFLGILDKKGAFLISKSSEKLCTVLGVSKFTFYNYLDLARGKGEGNEPLAK